MVGVRKGVLPRSSMTIQNSEVKTRVLLECLEEGRMGREAQTCFCTFPRAKEICSILGSVFKH